MCTGCSLCWDFCPRGGLRYEAMWPPSTSESEAGEVPVVVKSDSADTYWKLTGGRPATASGPWSASTPCAPASRADDVQDGGVVTAMLLALLAGGDIDGALVVAPERRPRRAVEGRRHVATTAEEILAAAGSFYNQTMALAALDLSRYDLPPKPRLAVVGTPCEIQGIRAMQARRWPTGAHRVDAVALTIALLCTKSFDYEALMLRELRDKRGLDLDRVGKVDVIHGRMIVEDRDGAVAVDEPVKDFHGAALKGCDECADFLGRGADISVGSVGLAGGMVERARAHRGRSRSPSTGPGVGSTCATSTIREALVKLDKLDKRIAERTLQRKLDPDGPLFIDFAEHLDNYRGTDRAPVVRDR